MKSRMVHLLHDFQLYIITFDLLIFRITHDIPTNKHVFGAKMDQERNRRFSTDQMKIAAKRSLIRVSGFGNSSDHNYESTVVSQFRSQECPVARVTKRDVQVESVPEDLNVGVNSASALNSKSSPMKSLTKRHISIKDFAKESRITGRTLRTDIEAGTAERRRLTPEKDAKKQRFLNEKFPISSRRMSCPDSSLKEQFGAAFSRTSMAEGMAMSKRKLHLTVRMKNYFDTEADEPRDCLPKINESLGSFNTNENQLLLRVGKQIENKTQKSPSPRAFDIEKSTDEIHLGFLESKLSVVSSPTSESEGNNQGQKKILTDKSKIIEITFDNKQHDIAPSKFINLSTRNNAKSSAKIKQGMDIDLIRLSVGQAEMTRGPGSRRPATQSKGKASPRRRRVNFTPNSMNGEASQETVLTTTSEQDIDRKVQAFLRSQQPMASPETLKVKVSKKSNSFLPNYTLQERRYTPRVCINTDTCPSTSNLINQDLSWYYQDRTGKCRYLRVPESPVPPVEWIFEREDE